MLIYRILRLLVSVVALPLAFVLLTSILNTRDEVAFAGPGAVQVGPSQGVEFNQISFTWPDDPLPPYSDTGEVVVDVDVLTQSPNPASGYLNVYTDEGWVIQNLEVLPDMPDLVVSTALRLGTSGSPMGTLNAYVEFSPQSALSFSASPIQYLPFNVGQTQFNAEGFSSPVPSGFVPAAPAANAVAFQNPAPQDFNCHQRGHTNVEAAHMQCGPASVANSLDWLRIQHGVAIPQLNDPGENCPAPPFPAILPIPNKPLVTQLDAEMTRACVKRRQGSGINGVQALEGKLCYIDHNNLRQALDVKHQSIGTIPAKGVIPAVPMPGGQDFTRCNVTSKAADDRTPAEKKSGAPPGLPTANFIIKEVCALEDVELFYAVVAPNGVTVGHFVNVVAAGTTRGVPKIRYISDTDQVNDNKGTTDNKGRVIEEESSLFQAPGPILYMYPIKGGGVLNIPGVGLRPAVQVIGVMTESPAEAPVSVGGISELHTGGSDSAGSAAAYENSGGSAEEYAVIAAGVAAAVVALAIAGWYTRRRWLRQRGL